MNQSVENGVGQRRLAQRLVPVLDLELAGDDGGAELAAVLDDLEQVGSLRWGQRRQGEIVYEQDIDPGPGGQQFGEAAVSAGYGELAEEPGAAPVQGGAAVADSGLSQAQPR